MSPRGGVATARQQNAAAGPGLQAAAETVCRVNVWLRRRRHPARCARLTAGRDRPHARFDHSRRLRPSGRAQHLDRGTNDSPPKSVSQDTSRLRYRGNPSGRLRRRGRHTVPDGRSHASADLSTGFDADFIARPLRIGGPLDEPQPNPKPVSGSGFGTRQRLARRQAARNDRGRDALHPQHAAVDLHRLHERWR